MLYSGMGQDALPLTASASSQLNATAHRLTYWRGIYHFATCRIIPLSRVSLAVYGFLTWNRVFYPLLACEAMRPQ